MTLERPTIDLAGKTALVTGATGALGRALARTLARCGADVAVHYHRNATMAETLKGEIEALGRRAMVVQADVTELDDVAAMKEAVERAIGPVDILVNNAVIQYAWKPLLEQPLEDYDSQYRSCVRHNVLTAKAFVPGMIQRGWGRVIGINTECAVQAFPTQSAYTSAKRGMDGILRVLAKEVGPHGITVNQVAPGWTLSELNRDSGEEDSAYKSAVPLGRRGTDQEIANVVAFLASDLASFITGAYIPVCGGNVMPGI